MYICISVCIVYISLCDCRCEETDGSSTKVYVQECGTSEKDKQNAREKERECERDGEKGIMCDWLYIYMLTDTERREARVTERKSERFNVYASVHLCEYMSYVCMCESV